MADVITSRYEDGAEVWDFVCPYPSGCGNAATGQPFSSTGWPDRTHAYERGRQHIAEHNGEGVTPDLNTFRQARGLIPEQPMTAKQAIAKLEG